MALAHLWSANIPWDHDLAPVAACVSAERRELTRQLETGAQTTPTSSMEHLFDAVAALMGVRQVLSYDAQAVTALERIAATTTDSAYPFAIETQEEGAPTHEVLDPAPALQAIIADLRAGVDTQIISARFHEGVAAAFAEVCERLRARGHGSVVGLSGSLFVNVRLLDALLRCLQEREFEVLVHHAVPCTDAGLALGQAVIGMHRLMADV